MSQLTTIVTATLYGLLCHPATGKLLVLPDGDGWGLPKVQLDGPVDLTAATATKEMSRIVGRPLIAYIYVYKYTDEDGGRSEALFALDGLKLPDELPAGGQWISREAAAEWVRPEPVLLNGITDFFSELEAGQVPALRQPWERPGWFDRAADWIKGKLAESGMRITAEPEQLRSWSLSTVIRTGTDAGDVYFKVSAKQPLFINGEASLLTFLGAMQPGSVPGVIASEPSQGWMLLKNAGAPVDKNGGIEPKMEVIRQFGRLQLTSAAHIDKLLALGCADRRGEHLISRLDGLLDDDIVAGRLTEDEKDELLERMADVKVSCERIRQYAVPSTLIHGDLHTGNVAVSEAGFVFFDWTDAAIAHPFMDMIVIYHEKDEANQMKLRDAYLQLWTEYEPMERLLELWALCEVVHGFYHAVSYQSILHHTEPRARGELGGSPAFYLRNSLRFMRRNAGLEA